MTSSTPFTKDHPGVRVTCFAENAERGSGPPHSAVLTANAAVQLGCQTDLVLHRAQGGVLEQLSPKVNVVPLDGAPSFPALRIMQAAGGANLVFSTLLRSVFGRDPAKWVYWSLPALRGYLQNSQPRILIAFGMKAGALNGMLARLRSSPSTVHVSAMSIQPSVWIRQRRKSKAELIRHYRHCDLIFGCSEGVSRDTESILDLPPHSVPTLFEPVFDSLDRPAVVPSHPWLAEGIPGQRARPVIVSAGKLNARKDPATLIRAFAQFRQQQPSRLVIFGQGMLRESLLALARSLDVEQDVDLPGEYPDLIREFSGADLFAFASRGEGLGKVVVEALAAGLPVVSTDCPSGPREILQDGRFGTLVPVGDVQALATAMAAELEESRSAAEQSARARAFSSIEFTEHLLALALQHAEMNQQFPPGTAATEFAR